ncbi:MAG: hypothetical protein IT317_05470 [Anaerolineales bacterium]|nr:hypothetical protein [Anaerolineales bacterium]
MPTNRFITQQAGGLAALVQAGLALAALVVAFGLIGPDALTDSARLSALAATNPAPLFIQDGLKLASAAAAAILVVAVFHHTRAIAPDLMRWAAALGLLACLCLLANACLSLYAVAHIAGFAPGPAGLGGQLQGPIGMLGLAAIVINGLWYLLVSGSAVRTNTLPRRLSYFGLVLGALSLLPPLSILVLLLSVAWLVGLGRWLLSSRPACDLPAQG